MNHVFEECSIFNAQQMYPENMNAAFSRPQKNSYAQTYNPGRRNHSNFSWSQNNNDHSRTNHFQHPNQITILSIINLPFLTTNTILSIVPTFIIINTTFLTKLYNLPSKVPLLTRNQPNWRRFYLLSRRIRDKPYLG